MSPTARYKPSLDVLDRGPWMQTHTGRVFFPGDPRPEDVCIEDIAYALSMQCRYAGHTIQWRHISTAEHSVRVALMVASRVSPAQQGHMGLIALLHDAAEAYCGDLVASVKALVPEFKERVERPIQSAIWRRFQLAPTPEDLMLVKWADLRVPRVERDAGMAPPPHPWKCDDLELPSDPFLCFDPPAAYAYFMHQFHEYNRLRGIK